MAPDTGVPPSLRRRIVETSEGLVGAAPFALVGPPSVVEVSLDEEVLLVPKISRDKNDIKGPIYEDLLGVPPVGGRLQLFLKGWQIVTDDVFVLSVVAHGYQISVQNSFPGVLRQITVPPRDPRAHRSILSEIQDLLQKKAIVQVDDFPTFCLSPIFVVPKKKKKKKSGDLGVIFNLKKFNMFIPVQLFRMETLNVVLPELRRTDWAVSLDLKDAYLHVPFHPYSRRFLGFQFQKIV